MRLTNKMLTAHSLSNLYDNLRRLDRINEELSSGKKIQRPSDDPVGITHVMRLESSLREIGQYKENVDRNIGYLEAADSALAELTAILHRGRELAVYGANGTLNEESRLAVADEVDQLIDHAVQVGNSTFGGRYMFAYSRTDTAPFSRDAATGTISYLGQVLVDADGNVSPLWDSITTADGTGVEIGIDSVLDTRVPGDDAFGAALAALVQLRNELDPASASGTGDPGGTLDELDAAMDGLMRISSEVGAKMKRLQITSDRLDDLTLSTQTLLSKTEDIDVAETIMRLKMEENAYRLALSAGARIIQPTLMDFLR